MTDRGDAVTVGFLACTQAVAVVVVAGERVAVPYQAGGPLAVAPG